MYLRLPVGYTSDYLSEGLMRSLITASRIAVKNPQDYEARSNIMWTATWALNTLIGLGKHEYWMLEIGLPLTISEIGATPDMIPGITEGTICYPTGYFDLKPKDIIEILKESM